MQERNISCPNCGNRTIRDPQAYVYEGTRCGSCGAEFDCVGGELKMVDMSPTAPVTVNENGGRGSVAVACSLIPGRAALRLAEVFDYGARKHGANNWRKVPMQDHLDHCFQHLFALLAGDKQDDHLGHAFCRLAMAVEMEDESFDFTAERQLCQNKKPSERS